MAVSHPLRLLGLLSALALPACSGGSSAAPPAADMTGYWQMFLTPTGGGNETGPSAVYLSQTGAVIDGAAITGSMSGNNITITSDIGLFVMSLNGTSDGTTATGNLTITGIINSTGTFRMQRFAPTGTLSVSGTIQGSTVNLTTSAAVGSRDYTDVALTVLDEVEIAAAEGSEHFEIDFSPAGLAVGALSVPGTVTAVVLYRNDTTTIETPTTSGTLTVTQYDGTGFAGSFSLTLAGGGTITGTFTVSWDISAYDP